MLCSCKAGATAYGGGVQCCASSASTTAIMTDVLCSDRCVGMQSCGVFFHMSTAVANFTRGFVIGASAPYIPANHSLVLSHLHTDVKLDHNPSYLQHVLVRLGVKQRLWTVLREQAITWSLQITTPEICQHVSACLYACPITCQASDKNPVVDASVSIR